MVFFRLCERWTHADFKSTQPATQAEDYWQTILQDQPYLISLIFPGPVAVHTGKAYLGGKKVDNTGGKIVDFLDFLLEHSIGGNAALLEIKRPPEGGSAHARARQCSHDAGRIRRSVRVRPRRCSRDCVQNVSTVGSSERAFDTENALNCAYTVKSAVPSVRFELTLYGF